MIFWQGFRIENLTGLSKKFQVGFRTENLAGLSYWKFDRAFEKISSGLSYWKFSRAFVMKFDRAFVLKIWQSFRMVMRLEWYESPVKFMRKWFHGWAKRSRSHTHEGGWRSDRKLSDQPCKIIRKPCQIFDTKALSNFRYESPVKCSNTKALWKRYESPVKCWIRKPCQRVNTKALSKVDYESLAF